MGLMDSLVSMAGSMLGGQQGQNTQLITAIGGLLNNHEGGLAGLVAQFQANGMGDVVKSWVGNGQNLPISAEQISQVLGSDKLSQIAGSLGINTGDAANGLSQILPGVVDKLTPNGQVDTETGLGGLEDVLSGLLKKSA
jgi:uncharacterized protein YidB (DUF937 family)